jgi:hypothetical protein
MGGAEGAPRGERCPKLSRKTEEGQKEEKSEEDKEMEPMDADAIPGLESRSSQYTILGAGDRGWEARRDPPRLLKGSRT